jgi:hypothetical protein
VDDLQKQRLAQNEHAFRDINERIEKRVDRWEGLDVRFENVVCECSDANCVERVMVQPKEYRFVRSKRDRFLVAPRHDEPEIERVIYRHDRYWVVEKLDLS